MNRLSLRVIFAVVIAVALLSCVSMPSPGEHIVMRVKSIPHKLSQLQTNPALSMALEQGVTRGEVKAGRLMVAGCAITTKDGQPIKRRHGYILLPEDVKVPDYSVIEAELERADHTDGPYARFYGRYIARSAPGESDFIPDQYSTGDKAFRCEPVTQNGRTRLQVYFAAKWWDYDFVVAEAERNRLITTEELKAGSIALTECSPGVDSWLFWKVRIPDGFDVVPGDYIEAIAGVSEGYNTGALSRAIRKIEKPPKDDFVYTQGSYTVACGARVPLSE